MELELGFKITQTRADVTSTSNLSIAKDRAGPVFVSRETNAMFILTAHLKGFTRDNIGIKINEDGTRITISGKRPVQEIVMRRWMVYKKEVEMRGFAKTFLIPDGVVLDKIRARFNDDESVLTISMPKLVKGITGLGVEEVKEGQEPEPAQGVAAAEVLDDDVKKVTDEEGPKEPDHGAQEEETEEVSQEMVGGNVPEMEPLETENQNQLGEPEQEEHVAEAQLPDPEEIAREEKGKERAEPTQAQAVEEHVAKAQLPHTEERAEPTQALEEHVAEAQLPDNEEKAEPTQVLEEHLPEAQLPPTKETAREEKGKERGEPIQALEEYKAEPPLPHTEETAREEKEKERAEPTQALEELEPVQYHEGEGKDYKYEVQGESEIQQEDQKQEPISDVQEPTKEQEPKQKETSIPATSADEQKDDGTLSSEEESDGSDDSEADQEQPEVEKQNDEDDGEPQQGKKNGSERSKFGVPIIIAGSAILVSLFVYVVHSIRTKKRS